jgi:preprotein translocase subunit YajC
MEFEVGDTVLTNSGRIGKVVQVWQSVACVEITCGKTKLAVSYPFSQLVRLQSARSLLHQAKQYESASCLAAGAAGV